MEEVCVYDNEYYIVELTEGTEGLEENCIQYISIDGLKSDEIGVDYVEEVISCDNTEQDDCGIVISSVYSTNENVIVENIPVKPDTAEPLFIANEDVNEVIVTGDEDESSQELVINEDISVESEHIDIEQHTFETVYVPEYKRSVQPKAEKRPAQKKNAVTKQKTKPTSRVPSTTKSKSSETKSTSTLTTEKKNQKLTQVTSATQLAKKRKHKAKKEVSNKKLKVEVIRAEDAEEPDKTQQCKSSGTPQSEIKTAVEEIKPTRKSTRKVIKKIKRDLEDISSERKKDFRALTRVVFSPKKDKNVPVSTAKRSKDRKRGSPKVEADIPRTNFRETSSTPRKSSKRYRCKFCSNSYDIASSYYNHVRNTHGKDSSPASCHLCPSRFKNRDSFLRHLRLYHTGPDAGKTHVCYICKAKYNLKGGLVSHLKHTHNKNDKELYDAMKKCLKTEDMDAAINTKTQMKKFNKRINDISKKNKMIKDSTMIKIDVNGKRFPCYICKSRFTQKSSMYRHVRMTHKDVKNITSKNTVKQSNNIINTENSNKIKNKGNITIKTTKSRSNSKNKILIPKNKPAINVNPDKARVPCKYCENTYSSRQSLSNHVQIKHKHEKNNIRKIGTKFNQSTIKKKHTSTTGELTEITCNFIANFK